ncbi:MAG: tRNA (adenosine(37)-N6)-dimethylallyltransferase MiaA [Acidimicrobiia bacterium]
MLGPTASGKSETGLVLAEQLGAAIISVDSMQVYRGMDIGTAKPGAAERARVPHHLIDLVEPEEPFTVAEFQAAGREVLERLEAETTPALIVGGSGLHFRALVDPLRFPPTDPGLRRELEALPPGEARDTLVAADPAAGRHVDLANPRRVVRALEVFRLTGGTPSQLAALPEARAVREYRPAIRFRAVGLDPGEELEERVVDRLQAMLGAGLLEEVAGLADRLGPTARQAVGYKELLPVVWGRAALEEGIEAARRASLELARHQRSYFRRDPRVRWVRWSADSEERSRLVREAVEKAAAWNS